MGVDKKLSQLTLVEVAESTDLLYIVKDVSGVSTSYGIAVSNIIKNTITGLNRIISGQVIWSGSGYTFQSVNLVYELDSVIYISNGESVTLTTPDATNDRLDVIVVTVLGLSFVTGTPSATPLEPSIDEQTEIKTNLVLVSASSTAPSEVTLELIYDENAQILGGEWDTSTNASTRINLANTLTPINLTKDILIDTPLFYDEISFVAPLGITVADFNNIKFKVKSLSEWAIKDRINVEFWNLGVRIGLYSIDKTKFNTADLTTIQELYVFDTDVSFTETRFDEIKLVINTDTVSGTAIFIHLDEFYIQYGASTTTPSINSVGYAELKRELKGVVDLGDVSGTLTIDFSQDIIYKFNMTADTTLAFTTGSLVAGKSIELIYTGNFILTHPTGFKADQLTGFDGTLTNYETIYCPDATTPIFKASIDPR